MSPPRSDDAAARRSRLAEEAIGQAVYVLLAVAVSVAIAKRDWIARQRIRLEQLARGNARAWAENRALADLRADLSAIEHDTDS